MEFSVIFQFFLLGCSGSFTHCIGMCGGIAMGQNALRLMNLTGSISPFKRFLAALSWEYYLGKALSYSLIAITLFSLDTKFYHNIYFASIKKFAIILVIVYFIYNLCLIILPKSQKRIKISLPKIFKKPMKYNLLITGFLLGFIPCGLVYSSIVAILAATDDFLTGFFSAFFLA
jgi:sulfite exporter TauE/SafE